RGALPFLTFGTAGDLNFATRRTEIRAERMMGILRVQQRQRMDMGGHWNKVSRRSTFRGVRARLVALTVALLAAEPALAQDAQPQSQAEPESQAEPHPHPRHLPLFQPP